MGAKRPNSSVEEIAAIYLDEDKLKTFMDFYDFLITNKFGKAKTGRTAGSSWAIQFKGKKIGHFCFHENAWSIDYFDLFSHNKWFEKCEAHLTAEMKDFILANIHTTSSCCIKGTCHSVENLTILGKRFDRRVCACRPILFLNPSDKALEYAKALALIGKAIITEAVECGRNQ